MANSPLNKSNLGGECIRDVKSDYRMDVHKASNSYMTGGSCLLLVMAMTLLLSAGLNAQDPVSHRAPKKVFTSEDATFRFEYSDSLVSCKRDPGQAGRWIPESCSGYIPVCTDASDESNGTVACVAYPAADLRKGTNFQAAAFSVNQLKEADTESKCLSVDEPSPHDGASRSEMVNGVKFAVTESDGAAAGNLIDGYVYRSFHEKTCYELDIRIAYSNPGNYDPGAIKVFDSEEVRKRLKEVLETFTFLK